MHCDVWGPVRTSSVFDYKYDIVFIDDFSHVSWMYLLMDRVSVLDVVKIFFVEVINQFSVTPKVLHIDNALEFVQSGFQNYCEFLGVIHRLLALIPLSKMVWQSVNIDIFWM